MYKYVWRPCTNYHKRVCAELWEREYTADPVQDNFTPRACIGHAYQPHLLHAICFLLMHTTVRVQVGKGRQQIVDAAHGVYALESFSIWTLLQVPSFPIVPTRRQQ